MSARTKILLLLVFFLGCLLLSACQPTTTQAGKVSTDPALYAIADPLAENLMASLRNNDYQAFRANFDEGMRLDSTEDSFQGLRKSLETQFGAYQSLTPRQVQVGDGFINAFYTADFEKGSLVFQLVLTETEPHLIHGFTLK